MAAAAYHSAERLHDPRQNLAHDYTRRGGVKAIGLVGWDGTRQEERRLPDREDRERFDAVRSGLGSDDVVGDLQREVFGSTCQVV